jgi:AcrR family transcriptional regulator
MSDPVKRRPYDSSRRQEQARQSRARVLAAARRRFLDEGYAATALPAVAADAGVSVESIYKAFRNKAGVLKAVFDVAVAGDDEPVAILDRSWVAAIRAEPDIATQLRMYSQHLVASMPRTAPVLLLARAAAGLDADVAAVWRQLQAERLTGMTAFASSLTDSGQTRPALSTDDVRDVLWTLNSVSMYELLVLDRGWPVERYGDFVADALVAAVVAPPERARQAY